MLIDIKSLIVGNESILLSNVKSVSDIQECMKDIEYERFTDETKYIVKTPDQVLKQKKCVCYDAVELERVLFEKLRYEYRTYFIYEFDESGISGTHTFLLYKEDMKYWLFEHSWVKHRGIHGPFKTYENGKQYVTNKFKMESHVAIKEYKKFNFKGMDLNQFGQYIMDHY